MPSIGAMRVLHNSLYFHHSQDMYDIPPLEIPIDKFKDIDESVRKLAKKKRKQRLSENLTRSHIPTFVCGPGSNSNVHPNSRLSHLLPVYPQLDEETGQEILQRSALHKGGATERPADYYMDIEVSSFEKRQSIKKVDQKALSPNMCDEEYRRYFR